MLEILYQDEHCVAVNKPAGMLVHRSWLDRHETEFVMQTLRDQLAQYVYPIHRLDRPTSGVLLFALSSESARQLCEQFENRQVQKSYLAIVRGYLTVDGQTSGLINYPHSHKFWIKLAINQVCKRCYKGTLVRQTCLMKPLENLLN